MNILLCNMPKLNIPETTLGEIKDKLIKTYQPITIYLFGSYAWGNPDKDSDIDLLVVLKQSNEKIHKRIIHGTRALRGIKLPEDLLVYTEDEFNSLADDVSTLCYKIKTEGIKIYET